MPKVFYKGTPVKNPFTGKKTTITSGEKQRYLGMSLGGTVGAATGATAGAAHLNHLKKDPQYGFDEKKKVEL
jgi:hypothetical protein